MTGLDKYYKLVESNRGVIELSAQERLRRSRVTIVGLGCIGGIAARMCISLGIGYVRGIDYDVFEASNVNRQIFANQETIGHPKAEVTEKELTKLNPTVKFQGINDRLAEANGTEYLQGSDFVIQAVDDMVSRVVIHRAARVVDAPCATVSGAPRFRALVSTFLPDGIPFEEAMGYPCGRDESLDRETLKRIAETKTQRAIKAAERGASAEWLKDFLQGNAGWGSTVERVYLEAIVAVREAVRYLTGEPLLAPAPKAWLIDLDNPINPVLIAEPKDGKSWDCTDW